MSATEELSFRAVNQKRGGTLPAPTVSAQPAVLTPQPIPSASAEPPAPATSGLPFDPWRIALALVSQAKWIVLAGLLFAALGLGLGMLRFRNLYTASASLIRQELPNTFQASENGESFKPKQLAVGTLVSVMRSPGLLKKVSSETQPSISPGMLALRLNVTPERNTDVIRVEYEGWNSTEATAKTLALYGDAVVQLTRDLQAQEAAQVNRVLVQQLATIDTELATVGREMLEFSRTAQLISADKETDAYLRQLGDLSLKYETTRIDFETLDLKLESLQGELARQNPLATKLQEARSELNNLLIRYTEANPAVGEQRGRIAALEKEIAEVAQHPMDGSQLASSAAGTSLYLEIVELKAQKQTLSQQLEKLAQVRDGVQVKLSALPEKSVQLARIKARQQSLETARTMLASRQREAQMYAENAPGYYRVLATPSTQDVATRSRWPKTILITFALGALGTLGAAAFAIGRELLDERIKTARDFGRVTRLPVLLRLPPFGLMPAADSHQWAFQTWASLAGQLRASNGGPIVLGVLASKPGEGCSTLLYRLAGAAAQRGHSIVVVSDREAAPDELQTGTLRQSLGEALQEPRGVFAGIDPAGSWIHWLEAGRAWQWTRERRQQWLTALAAWRHVRSLVILVELPATADPDALLLAETLPNLIWLGSESSDANTVRQRLGILRASQCQLLGAAFNQPAPGSLWSPLGKWGLALGVAMLGLLPSISHGAAPAGPASNAAWQERLTLGAGDTINLAFFGRADLSRTEVPIGPDGRISYLEAHEITAAGLTIDELRTALNTALGKYYRDVHTIVTPGTINSKRYYMLGKVVDKGAFTLERPLTILEAVARSRGLETGLFQQNTVELADLPRAFLSRQGRRMPVDFEALFQRGDLSQNIQLQPEDYLYFPSANVNEVYVLGAVKSPGIQGFTPNATVISMATVRGGFTEKAWLDRILVIRGSLNRPQTFVVDVRKVLKARSTDFALQPKDIVYVSDRPWARAEELVDIAIRSFVQAASAGWASGNVGPLITSPIVPSIQ